MPLSVATRFEENFAILQLSGTLTLGPSLAALRQVAQESLKRGQLKGIILHVAGVTMTDSAGLGELTVVYSYANRNGCPLMLADVPVGMRNILEITRLDALLPAATDIEAAKSALKGRTVRQAG